MKPKQSLQGRVLLSGFAGDRREARRTVQRLRRCDTSSGPGTR
jgi:hypothetical protein